MDVRCVRKIGKRKVSTRGVVEERGVAYLRRKADCRDRMH
jgi:hypothetical protein